MSNLLQGKGVVVTGAVSGIGRAIAMVPLNTVCDQMLTVP